MITCTVICHMYADAPPRDPLEMATFDFSYEATNPDEATQIAWNLVEHLEVFQGGRNADIYRRKYEESQQAQRQRAATLKES